MEINEVKSVAELARLALCDAELAEYGRQLTDILAYVRLLDDVPTDGVEPMPHAIEMSNVFRADEQRESLPREAALSNAPLTDGRFFLVPQILEEKPVN